MKAIKDNKVYKIDETSKSAYLNQGFDICSDDGKIIEYSPTGTVSRAEYNKVVAELERLKKKGEK